MGATPCKCIPNLIKLVVNMGHFTMWEQPFLGGLREAIFSLFPIFSEIELEPFYSTEKFPNGRQNMKKSIKYAKIGQR